MKAKEIQEKVFKESLQDTNLSEEQKKLIKLDPRIEKIISRTVELTKEEIIKVIEEEISILKRKKKGMGLGQLLHKIRIKIKVLKEIKNKLKGKDGPS